MRHFSACAVGVVVAAVIGCGPGKELPDAVPDRKPEVGSGAGTDPFGPAPAASDPAAKDVLARAVKAVTENVPGGLDKAKVSRVILKGSLQRPDKPDMSKVTRTIEAVWADKALVVDDYHGVEKNMSFLLRYPNGWLKNGEALIPQTPSEVGRIYRTDLLAQHWLPLGITLADPQAVAWELSKTPAGDKPATTAVKVALPEMPVLRVTFDDATGVPVRVEYHPVERDVRAHKVMVWADHKPSGGLLLPGSVEFTQNGRLAERWMSATWEFPEKLDVEKFERPK